MTQEVSQPSAQRPRMAVAATFTVDPIEPVLQFWSQKLGLSLDIHLAPYGQVQQQLLDPNSSLASSTTRVAVVFLRPEDALRDLPDTVSPTERRRQAGLTIAEWAKAVGAFRERSANPLIVVVPASQQSELRAILLQEIREVPQITLLSHEDIEQRYPVDNWLDIESEILAHVPFTTDYFAAMATLLVRHVMRHVAPPHKVIVVDCDNTLWGGACGELAPSELTLSSSHIAFQEMLVEQHRRGLVLCLCSKNSAPDVEAVFAFRPDMPLLFEHILAHRINWDAKSLNLVSLAAELQLGLDSFIFIDDNPVECAEVAARCPEVLTLQIPSDPVACRDFSNHTWAFDFSAASAEAAQRSESYRQNRLRDAIRAAAPDFASFLAGLQLNVIVAPLREDQLQRAAELVVRTNQFNLTTVRFSVAELSALIRTPDAHPMMVNVSDRFGDYGSTGLIFLSARGPIATVDNFILSCRVLGRGVEAAVVNAVGRWAANRGLTHIQFRYIPTKRNAPAARFLASAFADFEIKSDIDSVYILPVARATTLVPASYGDGSDGIDAAPPPRSDSKPTAQPWHATVSLPTKVSDIVAMMLGSRARTSGAQREGAEPPRGATERSLAQLWAEVLGKAPLDRQAGFIECGGDSVMAVDLAARISRALGVRPSLAALARCKTLAAMADLIEALAPDVTVGAHLEIDEGTI